MRKLSMHIAVIISILFILNSKADARYFGRSHYANLSSIESPERFARLNSYPIEIIVQFNNKARPDTFKAWLNKKNITDKFEPIEEGMKALVGPEDGLRVNATGKWRILPQVNVLKTMIRGPLRKRDIDIRIFRVQAVEDNDLPTITATIDPPPNAAGWNNTDVSVKFNCSDRTAGIATCSEAVTVETEGANQMVSGTAVDKAGNQTKISVALNIDKTPPSLFPLFDPLPNSYGWNNSSVIINFECSDMTSGIASCPDPVSTNTEGADQQIAGTAKDRAGNQATKTVFVSLDMTPPVIEITSPEDDLEIYGLMLPYDFEVRGTFSDNLSGIAEVACNDFVSSLVDSEFSQTISLENGDNSIHATAIDLAGNESATQNLIVTFYEPEIELAYVHDFEWIWWDHESDTDGHVTFFKPTVPDGFTSLGSFAQPGLFQVPNGYMLAARQLKDGALKPPERFERLWNTSDSYDGHPVTIWKPIPQPNYDCLGLVATYGFLTEPASDEVICVRKDLTVKAILGRGILDNVPVFWQTLPDRKSVLPDGKYGIYIGTFDGGSRGFDQASTLDKRYVKGVDTAPEQIEALVEKHGPIIYHHPFELFFPDDPDEVLNGIALCWGVFPAYLTYDNFSEIVTDGCVTTSSTALIDDFDIHVQHSDYYNNPGPGKSFEYWLNIPTDSIYGNIGRAKSILNVKSMDVLFTDIQFWMFYPFNGPGRMRISPLMLPYSAGEDVHLETNGRHFGDWEHVTLRFLNSTKELVGVYMSRHSQGQWFSQNYFGYTLQFAEFHPIVYAAKFSHALYNNVYDHINYEFIIKQYVANIWLWDQTGSGFPFISFYPDKYEIVSSEIQGVSIAPKTWLDFEGRWGQNEPLSVTIEPVGLPLHTETEVGRGPTAPATKDDWIIGDPDNDWHWQVKTTIK